MVVFLVITLGFYLPIWFLRRRKGFNALNSPRKLSVWPPLLFIALIVVQTGFAIAAAPGPIEDAVGAGGAFLLLLARLGVAVLFAIQCFSAKDILEDHLSGPVDPGAPAVMSPSAQLSGTLAVLLGPFYLQHVINRYRATST
jgi:hypothetical protein